MKSTIDFYMNINNLVFWSQNRCVTFVENFIFDAVLFWPKFYVLAKICRVSQNDLKRILTLAKNNLRVSANKTFLYLYSSEE